MQQILLFTEENHQQSEIKPQVIPPDKPSRISGLIARQIDQLKASGQCNWIEKTVKLKFRRMEVQS